jgi:hypothetical protein
MKQYGLIIRCTAGLLGVAGMLGTLLLARAVLGSEGRLWWVALAVPSVLALSILFLDTARRGHDPPWFYDLFEDSEDDEASPLA